MPSVAVVSDSTHYLPASLVAANDIHLVSLYVHWDGHDEREAEMPGFQGFYEHLRVAPQLPTTSQPSVGDFLDVYEPLIAQGHTIASVHLSSGISGTCAVAQQAKARLEEQGLAPGRVEVIDSQSACGGMGLVVLGAAAAARSGADITGVLERADAVREALRMWFLIDTLDYLHRGGRIGAAARWLGSALRIKPILTLGAEITPVERVRTGARGFERMVEYLQSRHDDGADGWVVQHIEAHEQARRMVERGREIFGCDPLFVSEIGPVIGAHVGPGLLGVGSVPSPLLA